MDIYSGIENVRLKNTAVTLGKFEGLHKGHRALLAHILAEENNNLLPVVFTFNPHPAYLLGNSNKKFINTNAEKLKKLENIGIKAIIEYPFDEEFMKIEPEDFIKNILVDHLDAKVITVGKDYRFGYKRRGDVAMLQSFSEKYGFSVNALKKKQIGSEIVSSSVIKKYIEAGDMETANRLLGSPYSIVGVVLHGRKLGRTIGVPTTNLIPSEEKLLPPSGVYISKTVINDSEHMGITNIGYKPSVGSTEFKGVETYMFDFDGDVYGKEIEVKILKYLRPEINFTTMEDLKNQIRIDIENAQDYLK
ncbi:MAG: hypothetical protein K0R15_2903 [Clostridiales bacterium]|nr:hypothetical protein [Clostridiales bacterium]